MCTAVPAQVLGVVPEVVVLCRMHNEKQSAHLQFERLQHKPMPRIPFKMTYFMNPLDFECEIIFSFTSWCFHGTDVGSFFSFGDCIMTQLNESNCLVPQNGMGNSYVIIISSNELKQPVGLWLFYHVLLCQKSFSLHGRCLPG